MEVLEVSAQEYAEIIKESYNVFGTSIFNDLNKNKCDEIFYLLFRDGKFRLGIIGGILNRVFYSPFSAPFGGFSYISSDIRLQYIENAVKLLKEWATGKGFVSVRITLPPLFYESGFIAKQLNCMWREGFQIKEIELNHSFNLSALSENYHKNIWYNARKNLTIALNSGLQFNICSTDDEKKLAYDIICHNRKNRGHPIRMTWQQVSETIRIISADFFLVNSNSTPIASAIVFRVNKTIVQVIYWGDMPGYSEMKPMNFTAFKLFEYYKLSGEKIIDIGYSTENSIPNYGLCEFKESMGCEVHPKYSLTLDLK